MSMRPRWIASLSTLVDAGQIVAEPPALEAYAVDGRVPGAVVFPHTVEQVAAILRWAGAEKLAVLPRGGGSRMALGGVPRRVDLVLCTGRLRQIAEYDAANCTLTAQAGVPFCEVARLTAASLQTLPLQYAFSRSTLGGLTATNASTPKRLLYGGIRDLLLGLRVALPSGDVVHFGGKVVKNVAGYDMGKLFLGSLGALGVIVETTFKLYPSPERDETLVATFPTLAQAAEAAAHLWRVPLLPSQILLLNAAAASAAMPTPEPDGAEAALLVNVEGLEEAVERQRRDIAQLCGAQGASTVTVLAGDHQEQLRRRLVAMAQGAASARLEGREAAAGAVLVRLGTLPARVPALMEAVAQALGGIAVQAPIVGDCGVGQVQLALPHAGAAPGAVDDAVVRTLGELPRLVADDGGYAVIEAAPAPLKERLSVWGPPPPAWPLLQALKAKFDPAGVLNPGRFIGGL
jgi:glycolate oxidase FAD binding subunit